jgi:hypothetical protein
MKSIIFVFLALAVASYTLHQDAKLSNKEHTKYHLSHGN